MRVVEKWNWKDWEVWTVFQLKNFPTSIWRSLYCKIEKLDSSTEHKLFNFVFSNNTEKFPTTLKNFQLRDTCISFSGRLSVRLSVREGVKLQVKLQGYHSFISCLESHAIFTTEKLYDVLVTYITISRLHSVAYTRTPAKVLRPRRYHFVWFHSI